MKISRLALIVLPFCVTVGAGAQSLWSPGFTGYLTGKSSLQVGDLVSVVIDTNTKLTYTASNVSDRTLTLEFKGGTAGDPLSFLPPGSSSEKSTIKGGENIELSTQLVARVQKLDPNGQVYVEGSRTLEVDGRAEMLNVSGWFEPSMMTARNTIPFDDLADSKLIYASTLMQGKPVLTQKDIVQALGQAQGAASAAPTTPTKPSTASSPTTASSGTSSPPAPSTGVSPSVGGASAGSQPAATVQITEAKKRELLTEYLNKMLDLIFSKP